MVSITAASFVFSPSALPIFFPVISLMIRKTPQIPLRTKSKLGVADFFPCYFPDDQGKFGERRDTNATSRSFPPRKHSRVGRQADSLVKERPP